MNNPTLYIFGDSFSVPSATLNNGNWMEWQWSVLLSTKLKMTLSTEAVFGSSNSWILSKLSKKLDSYNPGDKIIVQTTQYHRFWFFKDKPYISNVHHVIEDLNEIKSLTKDEQLSLNLYYKHMQQDDLDLLRRETEFSYLNNIKWLLGKRGVELFILPGFDHPQIIPLAGPKILGTLQTISYGEFVDNNSGKKWYAQLNTPDQRLNHMCKDNHAILADRLYKHIKHKDTLNLADEYSSGFLSIATQDPKQLNPQSIRTVCN
tara:strand:+ start:881 stop:1663 length:783 start_codon:yes stop_codon:yes gene_type:complete